MDRESLRSVQQPLKDRYRSEPDAALVTLRAEGALGEGVTCSVQTGRALVEAGLHPASGGGGMSACGDSTQHGKPPSVADCDCRPDSREGQDGPSGVAERLVVPMKPVNAGGGKGPEFETDVRKSMRTRRLA